MTSEAFREATAAGDRQRAWLLVGALGAAVAWLVHGIGEVDLSVSGIMFPFSVLLGSLSSQQSQPKTSSQA